MKAWKRPLALPVLLAAALVIAGAGPGDRVSAQAPAFALDQLEIVTAGGRHRFTVEMAVTPEQRSRGLMFRSSMAADAGMLFDFGYPRQVSMWMKNTLISLDMLFITANGRIVNIARSNQPHSLNSVGSTEPVLGVLELNAGTAERLGIGPGDRVVHPIFTGPPGAEE